MILTFLLGALAGFAVPFAEPHVKRALEQVALKEIEVETTEIDLLDAGPVAAGRGAF